MKEIIKNKNEFLVVCKLIQIGKFETRKEALELIEKLIHPKTFSEKITRMFFGFPSRKYFSIDYRREKVEREYLG